MDPSQKHTRRCESGLSLVELLIVLAIVLIIASIAVPNFMNSRRSANEASAVSSLRSICSGQVNYHNTMGSYATLAGLQAEGVIDSQLSSGTKSGYHFVTTLGSDPRIAFSVTAEPLVSAGVAATGNKFFYVDQSNVIRFQPGSAATSASSPIQ